MKILLVLLTSFFATTLMGQNQPGKLILITSGQLSEYKTVKINDINFDLVQNSNHDTIYLQTMEPKFITKEGYHVGTLFTELPITIQQNLIRYPGWGYFYKLTSGWSIRFCEGSTCTNSYPTADSKIRWIFKRK
ncbi:hypothetical protein SAMN05192550_2587 [Flavobacterium glycines]|uniref:Uncharacterized protein n=2 Tax=Flavobacterium glycines TaxID=551990 RepID=A0A1G8VV46_9FLAO|nr:hypothetical protein [Flavobacterium glycines]SDJ69836.1 hypothetical protein SAMN05192550_2587 [Flavobacterium glycines]